MSWPNSHCIKNTQIADISYFQTMDRENCTEWSSLMKSYPEQRVRMVCALALTTPNNCRHHLIVSLMPSRNLFSTLDYLIVRKHNSIK